MTATLYGNIVKVIEDYLGPAAPRFVDRQIISHLHKSPENVEASDIAGLSEWVKVSLALLTDDRAIVDECIRKLTQLQ